MMNVNLGWSDSAQITERPDQNIREKSEIDTQTIMSDILSGLTKGELSPGDRLPNERTLCARYGTGRHTVRKAMGILERNGIVIRFVGRGSFVADPLPSDFAGDVNDLATITASRWSLRDISEGRLLFEPGLARLVAERIEPEEIAELEARLAEIEAAEDWRDFKEAKYAFHLHVVKAGKNNFLTHVFKLVISSRRQTSWQRHGNPVVNGLEMAQAASLRECRAILEALRGRNGHATEEAVREAIMRIIISITEH